MTRLGNIVTMIVQDRGVFDTVFPFFEVSAPLVLHYYQFVNTFFRAPIVMGPSILLAATLLFIMLSPAMDIHADPIYRSILSL